MKRSSSRKPKTLLNPIDLAEQRQALLELKKKKARDRSVKRMIDLGPSPDWREGFRE